MFACYNERAHQPKKDNWEKNFPHLQMALKVNGTKQNPETLLLGYNIKQTN